MVLLQEDPTGLSSPIGIVVVIAGLVAALVVALRAYWYNRKR